ncbi:hypothetical protein FZ983_33295 [Azospirillum sp. B21]|uniref:hypothetical protein n=1 Tax=Azospirillum sp. B21 TaxID=2607496 RepID=UPI0011ECC3F5|nr:hypothetical protein [Azospirillum sp. B21]KAA0571584.1 hypothetical protein FZ983_33295 [Azospirillum sp. B21]
MFTFLRRWLASDPPGSPSNPLVCGTPFLMEEQRAMIARTAARLVAERQAAGVTPDPALVAMAGGSHLAGQLLVTPAQPEAKRVFSKAWAPDNEWAKLMAVPLPDGPELMTPRRLLELLTERLWMMLEESDDPKAAIREAVRAFEDSWLAPADVRTDTPMEAAMDLVQDNLNLRTALSVMGALPSEPWEATVVPEGGHYTKVIRLSGM